MAEVIGLVASILQLVDTVARACTLIKDLHNAPKEQGELLSEIKSLQPLLAALQDRLLNHTSGASHPHIEEPLSALEETLTRCSNKLNTGGAFHRVWKPISWTLWNKKEAREDLDQVERFKSLLTTWLTMNIWINFTDLGIRDVGQEHDSILKSMTLAAAEQQQHIDDHVVNHLESRADESIGIACLYLNHKEAESQTPQNLLGSLWRQLILGKPIPAAVHTWHTHHHERKTRITLDQLHKILTSSIAQYQQVYLIIDAVDEYPEEQHTVLLRYLSAFGSSTNVMITSRPHIEPEPMLFPNLAMLEIQATKNDMLQYIDTQISTSIRLSKHVRARPELYEEIRSKILSHVDGMFLLVKLHINSLARKNTVKAVREALHQLPKDLYHSYDEAMERIDHQGDDDKQLAYQTLTWVANAKQPSSVTELQAALAIEPDSTALDADNLLDIGIVLSVCAGLVMVKETASVVRLMHYTTQEYMDHIQSQRFPNAHTEITSRCLTYLSLEEFLTLPPAPDPKLGSKYPLLDYSQYCLSHAVGQPELELLDKIKSFLHRGPVWKNLWKAQGEYCQRINMPWSLVPPWMIEELYWPASPLCTVAATNLQIIMTHLLVEDTPTEDKSYAASYCGHLQMVQLLLDHGADVNILGQYGMSALMAASYQGHEVVVQLLLDNGANMNEASGETPLRSASQNGHETLVQLLLDHGADMNKQREVFGSYNTAFHVAAAQGHKAVVRTFLTHGANVNNPVGRHGTVLQVASLNGHKSVVQLLLKHGADVNMRGGDHETALQAACCNREETVAKLLIQHGADVNVQGGLYGTALEAASHQGIESLVQFLLDQGANVNTLVDQDITRVHFGTALQVASSGGHKGVINLLLDHGADVNTVGGKYGTTLQAASWKGHEGVVQLLLDHGADAATISFPGNKVVLQLLLDNGANVNTLGGQYGTALQAASHRGQEALVQLLLDYGADVNILGGESGTALQAASLSRNEVIVNLLITHGADVNTQAGCFGTALQAASFQGHIALVESLLTLKAASLGGHEAIILLLLDQGNINAPGGIFGTAIQAASYKGHKPVVELLIEKGADVIMQGGKYGTAARAARARNHPSVVQIFIEHGADSSVLLTPVKYPMFPLVIGGNLS
ncbi:ankyrin repeat-containing domain protein [Mycena maculata]|uniref:Ankyrin repeat-containing domain protein n=1 Tax=Mycena maculata TaxID=230809 RepID=A0AAD7MIG2_9AGAR|nr:ankyrin repeat-containing domain protein [Mycena maculata]